MSALRGFAVDNCVMSDSVGDAGLSGCLGAAAIDEVIRPSCPSDSRNIVNTVRPCKIIPHVQRKGEKVRRLTHAQ